MEKVKEKKSSLAKKIFVTLIYIVLIAIIVLTIISNVFKKEGELTNLCGYSISVIQSGSMTEGGYEVGDEVIMKVVDTDTLRKGDIITFYSWKDNKGNDPIDSVISKNNITEALSTDQYVAGNFSETPSSITSQRTTKTDIAKMNEEDVAIIFHRIINIFEDEYGTRYFETQGDSNYTSDSNYVREDLVLGKCALLLPNFVRDFFNFLITPLGLCIFVFVPLAYILISQMWDFGKEVKTEVYKRRLFNGKIAVVDEKISKYEVCEDLTDEEKIFLFDITPQKYQKTLANKLWTDDVDKIVHLREKSRDLYWKYWFVKTQKEDKEELYITKEQARLILEEKVPFAETYDIAVKNLKNKKVGNGSSNV